MWFLLEERITAYKTPGHSVYVMTGTWQLWARIAIVPILEIKNLRPKRICYNIPRMSASGYGLLV